MKHTSTLLVLLAAVLGSAEASPFAEANRNFETGDFDAAAAIYETLVRERRDAPDVLFNLGNTRYRLNERGEAALAWRRALAVQPNHVESRQNLGFLKRKTGFLEFEKPNTAIGRLFSGNTLVIALAIGAWTLVLSLAALLVLRPKPLATTLLVFGAVIGLSGAGFSVFALAVQRSIAPDDALAVVTVEDAKAFTRPARSASDVITLPPGSEIRIVAPRGSWTYVDIPGDLRGWVESAKLERVLGYGDA